MSKSSVEYYTAVKKNKWLLHTITGMKLTDMTLGGGGVPNRRQYIVDNSIIKKLKNRQN